jgi:phenylpyruvate tautomerase PptA (4-oxalocrotonate tautomerase family)
MEESVPKIIVHAPTGAFDAEARRTIAAELTTFALDCEALPQSPFVRSTVWTYFNEYSEGQILTGPDVTTLEAVSVHIFVIDGGLDQCSKRKLIEGATDIFGRQLGAGDRQPVYVVIHEISESNWGIFGATADLAALRSSPPDAAAL